MRFVQFLFFRHALVHYILLAIPDTLFFKHTLERVALTVSCVTVSQIPDNVKFLSNFVLLDIF